LLLIYAAQFAANVCKFIHPYLPSAFDTEDIPTVKYLCQRFSSRIFGGEHQGGPG